MEERIDIIPVKKYPVKKILQYAALAFFVILTLFFGYRAYSLTRSVIINKSSNASPLLTREDISLKELEKLSVGDRRVNILILGSGGKSHPGGDLTDTILVASLDIKNNSVAMISLPRDLYIPIKGFQNNKINAVWQLGRDANDSTEEGYSLAKATVSDVLGVPIHYFVHVDFEGFEKVIDILGGVTVEVEKDLYDPTYPDDQMEGYDELYIQKGTRRLSGESALKYARSRHTTSDFDRAKRQQDIIAAIKDEVLKKENVFNVKKINQMFGVLADHVKTDLQVAEIESLIRFSKKIEKQNISSKVINDGNDGLLYADNYDGAYVLVPYDDKYTSIHEFIQAYFHDPFLSTEGAKISVKNGSKFPGLAQKLADELTSASLSVVEIASADDGKKYEKTFVYDYSDGSKKSTTAFIKKRLGENIEFVKISKENSTSDFEIVLGDDNVQDK